MGGDRSNPCNHATAARLTPKSPRSIQNHTTKGTEHNFNPTSPITHKSPSTLIGGLGVTITDESENHSIGTNRLHIVGVRHRHCDQTSSTRKDFLEDRERRRRIRRTGVMLSHLPLFQPIYCATCC